MNTSFENEEQAHLSFILLHHSNDDDEVSNFDLSDKHSYDELQYTFNDLHAECLKLPGLCAKQKKKFHLYK